MSLNVETGRGKIVRQLEGEGWEIAREGHDHTIYRHPKMPGTIQVPRHKTLSPGVARMIAKVAGWI